MCHDNRAQPQARRRTRAEAEAEDGTGAGAGGCCLIQTGRKRHSKYAHIGRQKFQKAPKLSRHHLQPIYRRIKMEYSKIAEVL